jgi:S1-C subfamily serine protease
VITAIDGTQVGSASDLTALLAPRSPGDRVAVSWVDGSGRTHEAPVTLRAGAPA